MNEKRFAVEAEVKMRVEVIVTAPSFEDALAQARKLKPKDFARPTGDWWPHEAQLKLKSVRQEGR